MRYYYNITEVTPIYAKLFSSLYQGTLRGCADEILVFTNLLAHADSTGLVDKHWRAISEETGISEERVKAAIHNLESPDPESRSPEEGGRRIIPIDEHRAWGWQVVNHGKYRSIRSEEDRREQNRIAQKKWRDKKRGIVEIQANQQDTDSNDYVSKISRVSRDKPKQKQKQEAYTEEEKSARKSTGKESQQDWLASLKSEPVYAHVDIDRELGKAQVWIKSNPGRKLSKQFFTNWINKIEPPLVPNGNGNQRGCDVCLNHPHRHEITIKGGGYIFDPENKSVTRCKCYGAT